MNKLVFSKFPRSAGNGKKGFKTNARKINTADAGIVRLKTTSNKLIASLYVNAVDDY